MGNTTKYWILGLGMICGTGCISDVTGERFDEVGQCWGGSKDFSYLGFSGCDQAESYAKDDKGNVWRFKDSCIGDDLTPLQSFDAYPDCPAFGVDLVPVMARPVSDDGTCLEEPYIIEKVPSDYQCLTEEGVVYDATHDTYIENGCNLTYRWEPVSEARRQEVLALPACE